MAFELSFYTYRRGTRIRNTGKKWIWSNPKFVCVLVFAQWIFGPRCVGLWISSEKTKTLPNLGFSRHRYVLGGVGHLMGGNRGFWQSCNFSSVFIKTQWETLSPEEEKIEPFWASSNWLHLHFNPSLALCNNISESRSNSNEPSFLALHTVAHLLAPQISLNWSSLRIRTVASLTSLWKAASMF